MVWIPFIHTKDGSGAKQIQTMNDILNEEYVSYKEIKKSDIQKLMKDSEDFPKSIDELFEESEDSEDDEKAPKQTLIEKYDVMLEEKNIFYDEYEGKFYDKSVPIITKLVNLSPEKYLRRGKINTIKFEDFKKQNEKIFENIKKELITLLK